jgi:hypothetical protein
MLMIDAITCTDIPGGQWLTTAHCFNEPENEPRWREQRVADGLVVTLVVNDGKRRSLLAPHIEAMAALGRWDLLAYFVAILHIQYAARVMAIATWLLLSSGQLANANHCGLARAPTWRSGCLKHSDLRCP